MTHAASNAITTLVRAVHALPGQLVLAVTGGGSGAIRELLCVPGGSRTVLEAIVPYSSAALQDWIGGRPEQFCCEATARCMAMAAYRRAEQLAQLEVPMESAEPRPLAGIGCTASLVSDRPKRGLHRIHVAWQTAEKTGSTSLLMHKQAPCESPPRTPASNEAARSRAEEEAIATAMILNAVAAAVGEIGPRVALPLPLLQGERIDRQQIVALPEWRELLAGTRSICLLNGADSSPTSPPSAVFPGAFHPLHDGHRGMRAIAEKLLGTPVHFELSILNVDKPPLDYCEIGSRANQFDPHDSVWLTRAPTFVEKARLFPGATFVVGADTIRRIAEPRYYGGFAAREVAIGELIAARVRFLVFGRVRENRFDRLADLNLPATLNAICQEVPEGMYRADISSTALRRQAAERDETAVTHSAESPPTGIEESKPKEPQQ